MHVTPSELRTLRQDGILIRFSLLDSMAYVLAETPAGGSSGTSMEQPCSRPHWGIMIDGEITFESGGRRQAILPGSAFHVPAGGPEHRFTASGPVRVAGFEPIDPVADTSDLALAEHGFEVVGTDGVAAATVIPPSLVPLLDTASIDARSWSMSSFVLTQVRFGPGTGYTAEWCDAAHWGLVTAGRLAIEWEDDVEILAAGDVYHCPGGPPGHRLEAADPASVIDLTPSEAHADGSRIAEWRQRSFDRIAGSEADQSINVAGLG